VTPAGTSRAAAISAVTFGPGRTPPIPGLAPCEIFSETIFTWSSAACSANRSGSKSPSGVRQPKYPVPTSQTRSPPGSRWYREIPPSPVSWANPPSRAPSFSARIALPDSAPKLIAETFSSAMS
jgi:hypothetical protein